MNYFNYFTEIETRFLERRGSILMLSTLDWALIETWREAGIPLEVVLRGIDAAFDKHDAQILRGVSRRARKINGLAWCAQAVLAAVEQSREAAIGAAPSAPEPRDSGFDAARITRYLTANAARLLQAAATLAPPASTAITETATRLHQLAAEMKPTHATKAVIPQPTNAVIQPATNAVNPQPTHAVIPQPTHAVIPTEAEGPPHFASPATNVVIPQPTHAVIPQPTHAVIPTEAEGPPHFASPATESMHPTPSLETLDRTLTVLEEKLFAALLTATSEAELVALREQAARELAPYRARMQAVQIKQVQQQFLQKRLLESHLLPRLSLFYMPHEDPA